MFFRFLTYNKFKDKFWLKYSPSKRLTIFQKLENIQAKKLHRPACEIIACDFESDLAGRFNGQNQKIYLNEIFLTNSDLRFFGMATLFHEGRHAFQYKCCFGSNKRIFPFSATSRWRKNFQGYANSQTDQFSFYAMQPVERDACKYAINRLKQFRRRFEGNFLFEATLRILEKDYAETKINAKKELGIFYQLKVLKNNRKNRENLSRD